MQKIENYGDILEKKNYNIISIIKDYETIWSKYIGNDGSAKPVEISGISKERDITRKLIWQWNYSIFRNLLILKKIQNHPSEEKTNTSQNDVADELLTFESQLLQAVFIIYNSIEIFDKICEKLRREEGIKKEKRRNQYSENPILIQGEYSQKYDDFLNLRNWITHNVRIVYRLQDRAFSLPRDLSVFAKPSDSEEGYLWEILESKSNDNFQTIDVFVNNFYEKILSDFKFILKKELDFFEKNQYPTIQQPDDLKDYRGIASGSFSSR